jgi:hypothetical protein
MSDSDVGAGALSNTRQTRTCYLAAPINTDLKAIEQLLVERQIQPIVSADLSSTAATFLEGAVNAISTADLFVAILDSGQGDDNIYLELGIAVAEGRRILIVAPPERPLIIDIAELPAVRADITNHEAIGLMIDQVLMTPPRKFRSQLPLRVTQEGRPIGDFADELQEKFTALGKRGREDEITRLVTLALEKSGYSTLATNPLVGSGKRADLVVWSDEFGPWIGNPLIIEVKSALKKSGNWSDVVEQVFGYLHVSRTRSALILYDKAVGPTDEVPPVSPPNIFFLDIRQLFNSMRTKSFARVMIDLRNRRVHGIDNV